MIHEPMLGRTNVSLPVCHSSTAPPCREFEQCIELITHRSSARSSQVRKERAHPDPALSVLAKFKRRSDEVAHAIGKRQHARRFSAGNGRPLSRASSGLGSNVSRCDGPPNMNSMMTRFTFGGACAARGRERVGCRGRLFGQQGRQGDRAEARPQLRQPLPPRQRRIRGP